MNECVSSILTLGPRQRAHNFRWNRHSGLNYTRGRFGNDGTPEAGCGQRQQDIVPSILTGSYVDANARHLSIFDAAILHLESSPRIRPEDPDPSGVPAPFD